MAGKDAAAVQPFSSLPPPPPSSREGVEKMIEEEEETRICWSREVDQNLTRLHSLQFGADLALDKDDHATAQILSLRLIGFLDSRSRTDDDEAFIRPIRRDALSKIVAARRSLFSESDRRTFEQAGRAPGHVFRAKGVIDIDKIKQSQYFRALVQQSEGRTVNELEEQLNMQEKLDCKISNVMKQAKLTSLYGNNVSRGNDNLYETSLKSKGKSPKELIDLEGVHAHKSHHRNFEVLTSPKVEEEEKIYGNSLGTKRAHIEMSSLGNDGIKSPSCNGEASTDVSGNGFVTARIKLEMDARQRRVLGRSASPSVSPQGDNNFPNRGYGMRSGYPRRGIRGNFVPPIRSNGGTAGNVTSRIAGRSDDALDESTKNCLDVLCGPDGELPEKLKNVEPRLIEHVSNEIMDQDPNVRWNDIAGLEHAKKCVMEMVIWPLLRPDLFKGCRSPGRGLLLFGPPGTGKTMIGKAIAGEAKATFFYISASSLTSKWIGEGEKLVRALFGVACCRQPAVIFVDEIDSLLSQRKSEGEHESSRRLKTQFLIEMEGFDSGREQILLIGATNRPQELDEAARRRLTKRLYIPLPSAEARAWIIRNLLDKDGLFELSHEDIDAICNFTEGYSGSDMKNLVKDASMGPVRQALREGLDIATLKKDDMRSVTLQDFKDSMHEVRPSVSVNELGTYEEWNKQFGSTISL